MENASATLGAFCGSMILDASIIREMNVISQDGEKLGKIVNVLFSINPRNLGRAKVLVFPDIPLLSKKEIIRIALEAGSATATSYLPDAADKPVEVVFDKAADTAETVLSKEDLKKLRRFYLFPPELFSKIDENKKEAHLSHPLNALQSYTFENKADVPQLDSYLAFFAGSAPEDGRFWTKSLNLTPIQCYPVGDSEGNDGEICGLNVDSATCKVTHLVISPGNQLVSLADFDFENMTCKRPLLESQPA
jgi:sporulation protein YlmC with PRC-barrel domain